MNLGTQLGPYEIIEPLGKGGMGEVYRAHDPELGRDVAIKLLPGEVANDPERLARLRREARSLAALNHPYIATVHGFEEHDGVRFIVMELVEGETLAARLGRGAVPLTDVCRWGAQIAEALAAAHERGIVHRDLKPENVMLTRSGVKLLDFGLAKVAKLPPSDTRTEAATHVTGSERLTREGTLLGTFQYMAPEQLEGHDADASSDVWALGAILHEMATGKPPFEGGSTAALIAAILEHEPARLSETREAVRPALDHLVTTCLAKDPDRRRQSASDLALDLRWLAGKGLEGHWDNASAVGAGPADWRGRWLPWAGGAAMLTAVAALVWAWTVTPGTDGGAGAGKIVFELTVPVLDWNATDSGIAVSPSGDAIAYMNELVPGQPPVLWLREFDELGPQQVSGTENAADPFWSPDGRRIGYVKDGAMWIVDRRGGPAQLVVDVGGVTFGPPSWLADDTILFSTGLPGGVRVMRVSADGGDPVEITAPAEGLGHWFPSVLPDGRRFLYLEIQGTAERPPNMLYMGSLDGGEAVLIEGVHSRAEYAAGHLVYWNQGALVARRFDVNSATFTGEPMSLGQMPGAYYGRTGMAEFSVARNGAALAYGKVAYSDELRWFDASGNDLGRLGEPGLYARFRISPAGDRVVMDISDQSTGSGDISIFDIERGVPARRFGGPGDESAPVWSPDGRHIAYSSDSEGPPRIYLRRADGSGEPRLVPADVDGPLYVRDWSADGRYIAANVETRDWDIHIVAVEGDGDSRLLTGGPGNQRDARFSPNTRWIAFSSEEPGRTEVFVIPFDGSRVPQRVSNGGGHQPVWHPEGSELYYANGATLYAVAFSPETGEIGVAREVFSLGAGRSIAEIDVSPDGGRFLVAVGDRDDSGAVIAVMSNWLAESE